MTKKAQFIIPNVFIKEAKFGPLARFMVRGRRAYRAFKGVRPRRPLSTTPAATTTTAATTTPAVESATYSPGLINRALSSTAGRVAAPIATGAAGYGFGSSSGYDEGFGQGTLSAQQMAAIQAMQMQQQLRDQARNTYDSQGFLDRLMGNNPF